MKTAAAFQQAVFVLSFSDIPGTEADDIGRRIASYRKSIINNLEIHI
jgi:hypothetical protein